MRADQLKSADILDILFENKNKLYGAYVLRKEYNARLSKALAITFAIAILLIFFIRQRQSIETLKLKSSFRTAVLTMPLKKESVIKKIKPFRSPRKVLNQQFNTAKLPLSTVINTQSIVLKQNVDSLNYTINNNVAGKGKELVQTSVDSGLVLKPYFDGADKTQKGGNGNAINDHPDIMPSYPGGMEALRAFLQSNLQNPENMDEGQEVDVKVNFVVKMDGKIDEITVVEDGGKIYNEEVVRVLKKMPLWIPGKSNGQNVSVLYAIPVKFLADNQ